MAKKKPWNAKDAAKRYKEKNPVLAAAHETKGTTNALLKSLGKEPPKPKYGK
jgi:hypothetical protein